MMVSALFGRLPNQRPLSSVFLAARTDRDDWNRSDPVMLCAYPTSRRCLKIRTKSLQLLEVLITIFLNFSVLITIFLNFSGINDNFPGILKYCDNRPPRCKLWGAKPPGPFLGPLTWFPGV